MLRRFLADQSGNFAILTALMAVPLILAVGFGVDAARYYSAQAKLQNATDMAALALAASTEQDSQTLAKLATSYLLANMSNTNVDHIAVKVTTATPEEIELAASGTMPLTFMQLARLSSMTLGTETKAMRSPVRNVELALVLDNTWSMSETDAGGVTKINTLKQAARELVNALITDEDSPVRIGLVPYADYVNVGTQYRNASWLDVGSDYSVVPAERKCVILSTKRSCPVDKNPTYSCTRYVDGVAETGSCGGGCPVAEVDKTVTPYESCSGGGNPTYYKWYGCIGSRKTGTSRLNDLSPGIRYPGYLETSQKCLNPIVTLTKDRAALVKAIDGMVINVGGYKPYTYIPAGMIWGQNVLSPPEPLTDAADYDDENVDPRKVLILMTDGDNTLRFNSGDGRHISLSSNASTATTQVNQTNSDTLSICSYAKSKKIEIFTVAFMVDNTVAKSMLETCASDAKHYFDASNSSKLLSAFSGIARAINQVRLAR
ncbi:TadE/TadG family type IV pilus assembly protein [Aureimonas sp. AU12]|uniref:TadE/TadG family type IV pilus assembly protein n=1 Tax=Aureimonas sp. AU12 TaxID=1638161 RepID=UPI000782735D|nr:TadE/TadG family type IV pilus assembly protein [Aureimonas sp. AU12]